MNLPRLLNYVEFLPGYRVGTNGSVWSHWVKGGKKRQMATNWRQLKPSPNSSGHMTVTVQNRTQKVHLLVLKAFVGPCPPGMEGLHWDDNPRNNNLDNLRWGTRSDNHRDAFRNGKRSNVGERNPRSKLTESCVRKIRQLLAIGVTQKDIGKQFSVPQTMISAIKLRKNWSHVQ